MARYDVFPNPDGSGFLLDVQSDFLNHLNTRMVVPLMPLDKAPQIARRLNPVFEIKGERVMMATQYMASVPLLVLKNRIDNLSARFDEITSALDMIFHGF